MATPTRPGATCLPLRTPSRRKRLLLAALALSSAGAVARSDPPARPGSDPVLTAVGDIADCGRDSDEATAALAAQLPGTIAALGDLVEGKAAGEYRDCFEPSWGALRSRIRPTPGDNGEYGQRGFPQLDDYRAYFGAAAVNDQGDPWYSYDYGTWHVIALDSNCVEDPDGCAPDSPQVQWLNADLAAQPSRCTVVYSHHPILDKPGRGARPSMRALLEPLYEAGVDLWLSGHRHTYRRYAPVATDGERDDEAGIRQFIVGTGGHTRNGGGPEFEEAHGVLDATISDAWGVLRLTLKAGGYDWRFVPAHVAGSGDSTDSGSGTCHGDEPLPATTTTSSPPVTSPPPSSSPAPPASSPPPPGGSHSGYWMLAADGTVYRFGEAGGHGDARLSAPAVDAEPTPSGGGYWVVDAAGGISAHGDAGHLGGLEPGWSAPGETATSVSATPSGAGYWMFTSRGRVFPFGDAVHMGDMGEVVLNGPVLDSVATPSGRGYYLVASDGGIFAFGDARFFGSMGGQRLNQPVRSLVPDPDGAGYWLVAADGGVFAFEAGFRGSMGATTLNRPVTGMVAFGSGYLMVAADGGVFNFSDRPFYGSLGHSPPPHPIVAVAPLP